MKVKPIKYREWYIIYRSKSTEDAFKGTWLEGAWIFAFAHTVRPLLRWWQRFRREKFPNGYRIHEIYLPDFWAVDESEAEGMRDG